MCWVILQGDLSSIVSSIISIYAPTCIPLPLCQQLITPSEAALHTQLNQLETLHLILKRSHIQFRLYNSAFLRHKTRFITAVSWLEHTLWFIKGTLVVTSHICCCTLQASAAITYQFYWKSEKLALSAGLLTLIWKVRNWKQTGSEPVSVVWDTQPSL